MNSVIYLVIIVILVAALSYVRMRAEKNAKHSQSDTQDHILESNTFETGHSNTWKVTKDPQKYAQIFVPKNKK